MPAQFRVLAGPDMGKVFPLPAGKPALVGRGNEADIQLNDPSVSRAHCRINAKYNELSVEDLASRSGVLLNGERVTEHTLKNQDVVQIGATRLQLEMQSLAEQSTIAPGLMPVATQAKPAVATQAHPVVAATQPQPAAPDKGDKPPLLPAERMGELTGYQLGTYRIGPVLAQGQSGLLFQATEIKGGGTVALKILWPDFSRDDEEVKRFVRAMKTMMPVQHPHLIGLHGAGKANNYCWIAMEYVDGESLAQLMARNGTIGGIPWKDALRVGVHVSRALVYAHHQRIVHRNITPQNIQVARANGAAKLGDLMLSKALEGSLAAHITSKGQLLGDLNYLAPERTSGQVGEVDERSDLYSLGATLYAALTGRTPLQGKSMIETILKIRQEKPASARSLQPAIPGELDQIVMKLLAKAPQDRYAKAAEVLGVLQQFASAQGVPV